MKKRMIEILVGTMLTAALITGCGSKDNAVESTVNTANTTENTDTAKTDTAKTGDAEKGTVVYGQVSEIGDSSITIEVGTQKEMEKPDNVEFEDMADGEMSEMPEMPEDMGNGEMPEMPEGTADGEMPQGNFGQGGMMTDLELTGEVQKIEITEDIVITRQSMGGQREGQFGGKGDFSSSERNGEAPEMPEDMGDGEMPEMPEDMGDGEMPEMPEDMGNGEISQMPKGMNGGEEITLADISVGDIVMITYNENGEIEKIVVISMNNAQMPSEDAAEEPAEDTAASAEEEAAAEE